MKLLRYLLLAVALALPLGGAGEARYLDAARSHIIAQAAPRVPLGDIATPAQADWLGLHYARAGYQRPTTIEDSPFGRSTINALVHPKPDAEGKPRPNQPRDPWSESMVRVFGPPARIPINADLRSLEEIIADAVYRIQDGQRPRELTNAVINRLNRWSGTPKNRGGLGSSTAWLSIYHKALADAWERYARERAAE